MSSDERICNRKDGKQVIVPEPESMNPISTRDKKVYRALDKSLLEEAQVMASVRSAANAELPSAQSNLKCGKCAKRLAREGCTQFACILCCDDEEGCEIHKKPRAQMLWKQSVLAGTTEVQLLAASKRKMRIPARRFFREPGFVYQGDTVVIWDLAAFGRNPKWREEAIRKSLRRSRSSQLGAIPRLRNCRTRFHRLMNELHLASQK